MNILNKFSIRDLLHNKKFAIFFSILVSFIFWLVISIEQNPEREQTFNNLPINISLQGTVLEDMGIDVVDDSMLKTASVTVYGPNYIVSSLKDDDIKVNATISDITAPGTYTVNLSAVRNSNKSDYSFVSVNPSSITVKFDYIDTKEYTVTAKVKGVSAVGGLIAEDPIVNGLENGVIIIKGPRTKMEKISSVVAFADINKTLSVTTSFDAKLQLLDADGKELDKSNFTISEEKLKVSVPISKKKVVTLSATFDKAEQALIDGLKYTYDTSRITVIGPPDTIDSLNTIDLSPVDVSKLSLLNSVFEVTPVLPDGVKILDNITSVKVSFNLSGYAQKTIDISNIKSKNKPSDISGFESSGKLKNVVICGPSNVISQITADDLTAYIDLSGKSAGEHNVSVYITSDRYSSVWAIGSYNLSVVLK